MRGWEAAGLRVPFSAGVEKVPGTFILWNLYPDASRGLLRGRRQM